MEKRQVFLLFLTVFTVRKLVGSQTGAERVTWGLLYVGPLVTSSLFSGVAEIVSDYDATMDMYAQQNLTINQALGLRVARDAIDYLVDRQSKDAAFVHLQRKLFEVAAIRGYIRMKMDGYKYYDYIANGVPCRVIVPKDMMYDVKLALGHERGALTPERMQRLRNFRWVLQHHGGGYISGTALSGLDPGYRMGVHARNASEREVFDLVVVIVDYILAPEVVFPGAVVDGVNAYEWHCSQRLIPCSRIALSGESAGGGLVMAMILALQDKNRLGEAKYNLSSLEPGILPSAAVIMSPFLDVRHDVTGCPIRELKDVITTEAIQGAARIYCPTEKACEDPLASPILSDVEGTPPLMISAGADEILYPAIVDFYQRVVKRNPNQAVILEEYHEMYHSFQLDWNDNCHSCKDVYGKALDFVVEHTS